jgi:uncharacterized coiled-coil protein SlyX
VSVLVDILDRLSGIAVLKERINEQVVQQTEMRKIVIEQQKDIAELKGQLKALIIMQGQVSKGK